MVQDREELPHIICAMLHCYFSSIELINQGEREVFSTMHLSRKQSKCFIIQHTVSG